VHRSRLPCFRTGRMTLAAAASLAFVPFMTISRPMVSRLMYPSVIPEAHAASSKHERAMMTSSQVGNPCRGDASPGGVAEWDAAEVPPLDKLPLAICVAAR
jgi:hypothetical protein